MGLLGKLFGGDGERRPEPVPPGSGARTLLLGGAGEGAERMRKTRPRLVVADIRRGEGVDLVADLSRPFPFRDGSFAEIVSLEFIEHIPHPDFPALLAECARALAPGGRWISGCPDLEALAGMFGAQCDCVKKWQADPSCPLCGGKARISTSRWLKSVFGNQEDYGDDRVADSHRNGFWFARLEGLLRAAGMTEIRRGNAADWYSDGKAGIKLVVEAIRR